MLKGIDPLLTPELPKVLAEMGHGDELVIADANFTAASLGTGKPVIALPGAGVQRTCAAVLSLLPLDAAVARPAAYMKVCDTPDGYRSAQQREPIGVLEAEGHVRAGQCEAMERFAFYDRVKTAFAIVRTGELQPCANVILKKGVLGAWAVERVARAEPICGLSRGAGDAVWLATQGAGNEGSGRKSARPEGSGHALCRPGS